MHYSYSRNKSSSKWVNSSSFVIPFLGFSNMFINFTTFIICEQPTECEQTNMISWTEIINDDNKYNYSRLHHIVPVQFHKRINPEAAPVPTLKVEIREGPVERRLAF